ncbi:hypothetical protein A8B78_21120 [Jannaschia sp. EhC01]|nr:hypothetical protein A8B78_21120 [Jannaschia sp. EhC01]
MDNNGHIAIGLLAFAMLAGVSGAAVAVVSGASFGLSIACFYAAAFIGLLSTTFMTFQSLEDQEDQTEHLQHELTACDFAMRGEVVQLYRFKTRSCATSDDKSTNKELRMSRMPVETRY